MDTAKVINIRVRRAKSWVERATTLGNLELAEKFIFYWIAFNALYGQPKYLKEKNEKVPGEFSDIKNFLNLVIPHDKEGKIRAILSSRRKQVDDLLGNKFLMDPCWKFWKKAGIFSRNDQRICLLVL